jgi:type I restriction enzyme S subunit
MNAQQLKNAILQEAIEGRLVPQDPNDEPASVLLERIRKEKERLVKEGKLKKKDLIETPITEEEIPFEIPESWEWVRWGALSESIQYGYNAPAKEKGRIKMVRISDIQNGKIVWETTPYCDIEEQNIDAYKLKINDILFARTGGTVGKSYLVSEEPQEAIYAGYLIRTRYSSHLSPRYLKMFMDSSLYWEQLKDGTIATAQPNCNGQKLAKMILPLPPLAEQHRIVAKIEELLPEVEEYGKAQDELNKLNEELPERLKKSILQEAIEGRLVPQDPNDEPASVLLDKIRKEKEQLVKAGKLKKKDLIETPITEEEIPFDIPESWEKVKLSFVTSLTEGEKKEGNYVCLDAKYLRGKSTGDILSKGKFVYKNDNIILVDGENSGEVFTVPCDGYMGSTFKQLWVSNAMCLKYVLYFIKTYKDILRNSKKGAAIPHLNKDIFNNLVIGIPPLSEQHRIVEKLEQLLGETDKLK